MPDKSIPSRSVARTLGRFAVGVIVVLGLLRLGCFLTYAWYEGRDPLEAYHLEAKMAHLAWRAQHGAPLYPAWADFPHVANFFAPLYFVAVGRIGRATGAGLGDLFLIGRGLTGLASVATLILTTAVAWSRWGRWPALAAAVVCLGSGPMVGFGIMVRPDTLADFLGLAGFLAATGRDRRLVAPGAALLVAAILTKQTTALYLVAAALALLVDGRPRTGALVAVGAAGLLAAIVAVVAATAEPRFAADLLGESRTPVDLVACRTLAGRILVICPEMVLGMLVGCGLWAFGPRRDRRLAALAAVLLVGSLGAALKKGADLNYFLGWRAVAALALAELLGLLRTATGRFAVVLAVLAWLGVLPMRWSTLHAYVQAEFGYVKHKVMNTPRGELMYRQLNELKARMRDPGSRTLTDRGLVDIEQGERTVFGDPWLFRMLVETGRIRPDRLVGAIERQEYDWIVTTKPLDDPGYAVYEFGMPMPMVEAARRQYVFEGDAIGMFFYKPRRAADAVPALPRP